MIKKLRVFFTNATFHKAVRSGNIKKVRKLVESGVDVNVVDKKGETPLHMAVGNHHTDIAILLLKKGADVHSRDKEGRTPLMLGTNVEIVQLLIDHGADIKVKANDGGTLLHHDPGVFGDVALLNFLIEKGIEPNSKDKNGRTPLDIQTQWPDGLKSAHFLLRAKERKIDEEFQTQKVTNEIQLMINEKIEILKKHTKES